MAVVIDSCWSCFLQGMQYIQTPRLDQFICRLADDEEAANRGPTPKQFGGLPTLDGFKFHSKLMFRGEKAEKWTYKHKARCYAAPAHESKLVEW
jgi:hypothetical protein